MSTPYIPHSISHFWYNGTLIQGTTLELAIDDPGLLYGATVFTTLRVYHQSLTHPLSNWSGHCERLQNTLELFNWRLPDWKRLRCGAEALLASFPILRIAIFPDGREWITGRFLPADLTERQQLGIPAWLADSPQFQRSLPAHKIGNYLPTWIALKTAQLKEAKEAILVDSAGNWLETSTGNLWGWRDNCWWTPPLEAGILPGLVRSQLISWLVSHNHNVEQKPWSAELVATFEAVGYSNSVVEIVPIYMVWSETTQLSYHPTHHSFQQLRQWFQDSSAVPVSISEHPDKFST